MSDLLIVFFDGRREVIKNANGAGFEDGRLLVISDGKERYFDNVSKYFCDYNDMRPFPPDANEITQD